MLEAPIGPGVYEVRHTMTGALIAFGHAGNVANAIAELKVDADPGLLRPDVRPRTPAASCRRP